MRIIDILIVLAYLIGVAAVTLKVSRRQRNKEDYIMAGRNMHWFPLALSGVAAGFSAISLLGAPGFVMSEDMKYLPTLFLGLLSVPIIYYLVVPFLYKLRLVSVYSYLGTRFCPAIRYVASALFMISKLGYLAMSIFTPSLALSAVTGLPIELFIVILGVATCFYTMLGGMTAVVWTDVMQYFIIILGIAGAVCFFLFGTDGSAGEYWRVAVEAGKTKMFDFSWDLGSLSVWVIFINGTILGVASTCSSQDAVQRLCSAKSLGDSMKSFLFSIIFGTPIVLVLYLIGAWLYGFFQTQAVLPPELAGQSDRVFPYFIAHYMPVGVAGILMAGILAAGMSTISVVMHSLTSVFMVDVYEKFAKCDADSPRYVRTSRIVTCVWGALAVLGAFYVMLLGNNIIEVTQTITGFTGATLGGIFLLGIFTRRTNSVGVLCGCVAGIVLTVGSWYLNKAGIYKINFMWYGVFGIAGTCIVGYVASWLSAPPSAEQLSGFNDAKEVEK